MEISIQPEAFANPIDGLWKSGPKQANPIPDVTSLNKNYYESQVYWVIGGSRSRSAGTAWLAAAAVALWARFRI
jgi:hypothetical protein